MVYDSIFESRRTDKEFSTLSKKAAKLQEKKTCAAKKFMSETSPETLREVFDAIENNGHPYEQEAVRELRNKYEDKRSLDFNDIVTLRDFYKSICNTLKNKDDSNG